MRSFRRAREMATSVVRRKPSTWGFLLVAARHLVGLLKDAGGAPDPE